MIFFLVKVFENKEHANDLMRGRLFINSLAHFKKIEGDDGRGDEDEGAVMFQLREGLTITLATGDEGAGQSERFTIPIEDLAAPPILRPRWYDHIKVYCMYAGHTGDFQSVTSDNIGDLESQLRLSEGAKKLGSHAIVIKNVSEFIKRVKEAASLKGYGVIPKLVEYYDPEVGSPSLRSQVETIFTKRKEFDYQSEFRLAIDTGTAGCDPITLDIGEIDDIAFYANTSEIDVRLYVDLEQEGDAQ